MNIKLPRWIILFILFTAWVVLVSKFPRNSLLYPLLFAPLVEELVFRSAVIELIYKLENPDRFKWQVVIISSFLFGFIHFHQNMFIVQGVFGFILSYLYIRFKERNKLSVIRSYLFVVFIHGLWNLFCYTGLKYLI